MISESRNIKGCKSLYNSELLETLNISVKSVKEIEISRLSLSKLKLIEKVRRIKNYEHMSQHELLGAFKKSSPFESIKKINKNHDKNKIRYLRALYEPEEDYYKP